MRNSFLIKHGKIVLFGLLVLLVYLGAFVLSGCMEGNDVESIELSVTNQEVMAGSRIKFKAITTYDSAETKDTTEETVPNDIIFTLNSANAYFDAQNHEIVAPEAGSFTFYLIARKSKVISNPVFITVLDENGIKEIRTADDFLRIEPKKHYIIKNDIDFEGKEVNVFPDFYGKLDGENRTLKNITINTRKEKAVGLFSANHGIIKNLRLEGFSLNAIGDGSGAGALAGENFGELSGIEVTGSVNAEGYDYVGGIVGFNQNKISNCINHADVRGRDYTGGVIGIINPAISESFEGFENHGNIFGNSYVGGVLGGLSNVVRVEHPNLDVSIQGKNLGDVTGRNDSIGGITGYLNETSWTSGNTAGKGADNSTTYKVFIVLNDCENQGSITGRTQVGGVVGSANKMTSEQGSLKNSGSVTGDFYIGGFFGYINTTLLNGYTNTAHVSGKGYVGGIAGYAELIDNCTNSGIIEFSYSTLENNAYTGGIAGYINGTVNNSVNNAEITILSGTANCIGGIAGYITSTGTNANNTNRGVITGAGNVGGLFGSADGGIYEKNTNESQAFISGDSNVGGIFGLHSGGADFANASFNTNKALIRGESYVGGIAGNSSKSGLINNQNIANIECATDNAGGIAGYALSAEGNTNIGNVTGNDYVGGIVGTGSSLIANQAEGSIIGRYYVGGIAGKANSLESMINVCDVRGVAIVGGIAGRAYLLKNLENNGTVLSTGTIELASRTGSFVGGIAGQAEKAVSCKNRKDIEIENGVYVAGVVAYLNGSSESAQLENYGVISGDSYVGGIVAIFESGTLENCTNDENITAENGIVAGIVAYVQSATAINLCVNTQYAVISGTEYVGGIVGKRNSSVNELIINDNCLNYGTLIADDPSKTSDIKGST